ncbi:LuxR C-terminal-related transcriptional regulator [Hymenobacter bucti]|uniref:LuxR C-terminal-related transcriptional regulator n=1 Tax=Hymenobacter bucti TaxID=1844114 RepID=A0ABW4QSK1_9BACT
MTVTATPVVLLGPPNRLLPATAAQQASIGQAVAEVAATADLHPGVTIVHNLLTDGVEYMSRRGLELLQISLPALQALGGDYYQRFFNPVDAQDYMPRVYEMLRSDDPMCVVSFFQQVRTTENPEYTWYFSTTRVLLRDAARGPLLLITTASPIDPLHHVTHKVSRLLEENNFLRQHAPRFASLTRREREVLRLLALGHTAPQIGTELFLSTQTIETHRRNLRQKLRAESQFELGQYARAFDLI